MVLPIDDHDRNADVLALLHEVLHKLLWNLTGGNQKPAFEGWVTREGVINLTQEFAVTNAGAVAVLLALKTKTPALLPCWPSVAAMLKSRLADGDRNGQKAAQ
jgi:hypothetical protein